MHLDDLHKQGVSVWLDSLSRDMLTSGELQEWIDKGLRGQTSNPSIFQVAMGKGNAYDEDIARLAREGKSPEEVCWELMVSDVQAACDKFKPLYDSTQGKDGFVSLELDPTKARDTAGSTAQGKELWKRVDRPNLMLKVPGTKEGLPVLKALLEHGCNVNVTLLFDVERYKQVMDTHMEGLEARLAAGGKIDHIATVASFFVSRVDTEAEKRLEKMTDLPDEKRSLIAGKVAIANARKAYRAFLHVTSTDRWHKLAAEGAQIMRPLWASTGVKNKAYSDTMYVDELVGPHCVNTMPDATLKAVLDHGQSSQTLMPLQLDNADEVLKAAADAGLDMDDITQKVLEDEGVDKFEEAYHGLLKTLTEQMQSLKARS